VRQRQEIQEVLRLILTIGHSTRPLDEFVSILKSNEVTLLVDVRTIPRSRHNPQFNFDTLPGALAEAGIGYLHLKGLGGLRHGAKDSPNTGWRTPAFRGYADYMLTDEFADHLRRLMEFAGTEHVALMCAEAVPWRCHRSLIADALAVRGVPVEHIMGPGRRQPHRLTPFARVDGVRITYPARGDGNPRIGGPEADGTLFGDEPENQ
jgi:uncharacterized protein (DUF488 family)